MPQDRNPDTNSKERTEAEDFRDKLLQTSIATQDGQECIICYEELGKMNLQTGLIELQVRLPCDHVVGSGCVFRWLKDNNTCPICRRKFFPEDPRQHLEHLFSESQSDEDGEYGEYDDDEDESERERERAREMERAWERERDREREREREMEEERRQISERRAYFDSFCDHCCPKLLLNRMAAEQAGWIFTKLMGLDPAHVRTTFETYKVQMVALAVYMASWLVHQRRSPKEVCAAVNSKVDPTQGEARINSDELRRFFKAVYDCQKKFTDKDFFELWDRLWPRSLLYDSTDDMIEVSRDQTTTSFWCGRYGSLLGLTESTQLLSKKIVSMMIHKGFHLLSSPPGWRLLCLEEVVAVSIYIASHLGGLPLPPKAFEDWFGLSFKDSLSTYRIVRQACNGMIDEYSWKNLNVLDRMTLEHANSS